MRPAGTETIRFFAVLFILTVAAQPASALGKSRFEVFEPSSAARERVFYAFSLHTGQASAKVVLVVRQNETAAFSSGVASGVSVVKFTSDNAQLKVVTLDFSGVKISVVERPLAGAAVQVMATPLLAYIRKIAHTAPSLNLFGTLTLALTLLAVQRRQKPGWQNEKESPASGFSSHAPEDFSGQLNLVLRC